MARARRTLGWNSVSVLDIREEYNAEVTISMLVSASTIPAVSTRVRRPMYSLYYFSLRNSNEQKIVPYSIWYRNTMVPRSLTRSTR